MGDALRAACDWETLQGGPGHGAREHLKNFTKLYCSSIVTSPGVLWTPASRRNQQSPGSSGLPRQRCDQKGF